MRIESKELEIAKSAEHTFNFLLDLNNIELLLPKDKISNFVATESKFGFKITGGIPVELELENKIPNSQITFKTTANNNIPFTLDIHLTDNGATCSAKQICNADINTFMKMMVEKPLTALFDYMVDRLHKVSAEA